MDRLVNKLGGGGGNSSVARKGLIVGALNTTECSKGNQQENNLHTLRVSLVVVVVESKLNKSQLNE